MSCFFFSFLPPYNFYTHNISNNSNFCSRSNCNNNNNSSSSSSSNSSSSRCSSNIRPSNLNSPRSLHFHPRPSALLFSHQGVPEVSRGNKEPSSSSLKHSGLT